MTARKEKNAMKTSAGRAWGEDCADHFCTSPEAGRGYRFSAAMRNPGFIGIIPGQFAGLVYGTDATEMRPVVVPFPGNRFALSEKGLWRLHTITGKTG